MRQQASPTAGPRVDATPSTLATLLSADVPPVLVVALLDKLTDAHGWLSTRRHERRKLVRLLWWWSLSLTAVVCVYGLVVGPRPGPANLDAPALMVLIALMMRSARLTWWELRQLAESLDRIIVDGDERRAVTRYMHRGMRLLPQLALSGLAAAGGVVLGVFIARATGSGFTANVPFVVLDAIAAALGANVIYWLWVAVTWTSRFSRLKSVELATDAETDAAIVGSIQMVRAVRLRVVGGLIVAEFPLLMLTLVARGDLLPLVAGAAVMVACIVTGIAIGILPVIYLGRVLRTDRDNVVARLTCTYDDACVGKDPAERLVLTGSYHQAKNEIRRRSVYPIDVEAVGLILATIVGPVLPFALALMLRTGGG